MCPIDGKAIKRIRTNKDLLLKDVERETGIPMSILSRIENGTSGKRDKHVGVIAKALGVTPDDITTDYPGSTERVSRTLRVGFEHSLWASPFAYFLMDYSHTGVKLCSYTKQDGKEPYWYEDREPGSEVRPGPNFACITRRMRFPGLPEWYRCSESPQSKEPEIPDTQSTYSSRDLHMLLQRGELDAIAIPGRMHQELKPIAVRCARIGVSSQGCTLTVISRKSIPARLAEDPKRVSWSELAEFIRGQARDLPGSPPIYYTRNTLAEHCLMNYCAEIAKAMPNDTERNDVEDTLDARVLPTDNPIALKKYLLTTDGKSISTLDKFGLILVIWWHPQGRWLDAIINKELQSNPESNEYYAATFDLPTLFERRGEEAVVFDLLVSRPKGALDDGLVAAVWTFLDALGSATYKMRLENPVQGNDPAFRHSAIIKQIAKYFDLDIDLCVEHIRRTNYQLTIYPEWLDLAGYRREASPTPYPKRFSVSKA